MNPRESLADSEPERWLDAHVDPLFRFALLRVRNEDTAEDLVQETLLAAWPSLERRTG